MKNSSSDRKMTDRERKGQQLESLRKKRAESTKSGSKSRKKTRQEYSSDSDHDSMDGTDDDYYKDYEEDKESAAKVITYEEMLQIQLKRDDADSWLYKPEFEKVIKGCFARVSLGAGSASVNGNREPVYRCVYITDTPEYHRKYKINKSYTKIGIMVQLGKAKKQYLMDVLSNQPITEVPFNSFN
jgi:hypothetical protein